MIVNVKAGETKTGRLPQNSIGGISPTININAYDLDLENYGLYEKDDSVKVFNWVNYSSFNPSHSLLTVEQGKSRAELNKRCNIPKSEDYQGIEQYILTRTGRSTIKIERLS